MPIDAIEDALTLLCDKYIFPEKAAAAAKAIRDRRDAGQYQGLSDEALAERLTAELYEVCADGHLNVQVRGPQTLAAKSHAEMLPIWLEQSRLENYGIAKVERLDGNVGYIDLRHVIDPSVGGPAIAAAMELVSHTYALIIDLRKNFGGFPDGVAFWHSYLFPDSTTHLNDITAMLDEIRQALAIE